MQKKNYRYNKLYKIESRDVMKFQEFREIIFKNIHNDKLTFQFQLFFLSLAGNNNNLERSQSSFKIVPKKVSDNQEKQMLSYGQKTYIKDLANDEEAFKQVMKKSFFKRFLRILGLISTRNTKMLRSPLSIELNFVARRFIIILMVSIFFLEFVKKIFLIFEASSPIFHDGGALLQQDPC